MKTILKLWRGQLSAESLSDPSMKEKLMGKPLEEKILKEAEEFHKSLSEEQQRLRLSYWMVESEEWSSEDQAFVNGFKIGALLMLDILKEKA